MVQTSGERETNRSSKVKIRKKESIGLFLLLSTAPLTSIDRVEVKLHTLQTSSLAGWPLYLR
jgi:hypothetical protein